MKTNRLLAIVYLLFIVLDCWRTCGAEARSMTFLHALQERGYGDVAVDYLNMLKQRDDLPNELRETWDLEMSKSLRSAAGSAYNAREAESLLDEAQKHLSKFLQENLNHPKSFEAGAMLASFSTDKALKNLRAAQFASDKNQKAKMLEDARSALLEARSRFKQAGDKLQAQLDALPPPPKRSPKQEEGDIASQQEEIKADLMNIRFQDALIDYYLAQTYPEPNSIERREALKIAAKAFDAIFQNNRMELIGLLAHMWHGKAAEEMGDLQTALDIYDEVQANAPDPGQPQKDEELQSLFAQVQHFRLQILAKQSPWQFMEEAAQWIQQYRKTKQSSTQGYQGIALDLAKTQLAAAENAAGAEKTKLITSALSLLAEISQVRSPYQQEAILLRRECLKSADKGAEAASFAEALALADAAAVGEQWDEAVANYSRALKLADKEKIKESQRRSARDALANAIYMKARGQLLSGKWEECLGATAKVINGYKDSPAAPMAGSLAVSAALNLYASAPADKKDAALERLKKYAKFIEETWPDKAEADEARMMLAQAGLIQGKIDEALAVFEKIDPRSDRYPNALFLAADTYWRRWLAEMAKPEESRNKKQMDADLDKAMGNLNASLKLQRKKIDLNEAPSRTLIETQLLLAEILLQGGKARESADLLQPLIDSVKTSKPENVDDVVVRIFLCAVRAYLAQDDSENAVEAGTTLADWGPDVPSVNSTLIQLINMLHEKLQQAQARVKEIGETSNTSAANNARAKVKSISGLMGTLLEKMASRKQLSLPAEIYIADMCSTVGLDDTARDIYLRVANQVEKDPAIAKTAGRAITRVRSNLINMLAKQGDYEEANKQAGQLVAAHPRALEPMMEQGRILLTWSEKDPSHYKDAVAHWAKLRNSLLGMVKKPPEYFEATYNLAFALYGQASAGGDKAQAAEKAKQAQQLLKSTLLLNPNLSSPDMVIQYNSLLEKINELQERASSR